ncbi:MAG: Rieske 2Fe-2S domain-containing protein [Myxococcota bacterium]
MSFFRSKAQRAAELLEQSLRLERRAKTYPEKYPSGWYRVASVKELDRAARRSQPIAAELLGRRFALFRDGTGNARAVDAYCPHLGADMSGGRVCEGQLECPFHRWTFDGEGAVTKIPYLSEGRRLPTVRAQSHALLERDGLLLLWHGDEVPHYEVPAVPEHMVHRGDHDAGVVWMHLQEFAENSVDFQHFAPLHGKMRLPWIGLPVPGLSIRHVARWEPSDAKPWEALFHDSAILEFFGRELPGTGAKATITFHGPGSVVHFEFAIPKAGRIVMIQTHSPVTPMAQRVRFRWFAERRMPRWLVSYVVGNWVAQWREDISIWENKIFRDRPQLVRDDGPVHALRRWYRQFR